MAPFSAFRGPNLSAVNDQNPGKTPEKIKPTLHCRHYIMDITFSTEVMLEKLHHGHYDWMKFIIVILLEETNATCKPILSKFITSKFTVLLTSKL